MKKFFLTQLFITIIVLSLNAQLNVGAHFFYNSTWLMNQQVFDDKLADVKPSFGMSYGLITAYYFNETLGLEINFNLNKIKQSYQGEIPVFLHSKPASYTAVSQLSTLDIPVMLKLGKTTYCELGPMISVRTAADYSCTYTNLDEYIAPFGNFNDTLLGHQLLANIDKVDTKDYYKPYGIGVAFGIGGNATLHQNLKLNFGFRVNYIFTDMYGVNAHGFDRNNSLLTNEDKAKFKTFPLYGGIKIGLTYMFED